MSRSFASNQSFLDPQYLSNGEPYAPFRYKQIAIECYRISHRIHTSYTDLMKVTPLERKYMLDMIDLEDERQKQELENAKRKSEERRNSR